ncbi:MAG: hypothetical protein GY786_04385 [Proteobacteria bacterium]|nr:hypothetical protein [Pseudomonadota bacterium]
MQFIKKAVSLLGFKPSILKSLGTLQEIYLEQSKIESKFLDGAADHFIH